nr:PREDICTED: G patch domain and KOW motifs-containing protein-like [Bemisia tabaci]
MSAGKKRVSFGFSKLVKKPKVILPALKPAETVNFIKCVENNSVQVFDEVIEDEKEELVIPMKPSSQSSDFKPEATDSSNNPVLDSKKPESLDELAAKELVAEANRLQKEEEEASTIVVPIVSNLPSGEKESTLEDFKSIPIEKYGLAMLRGMSWKPGIGIGKNATGRGI